MRFMERKEFYYDAEMCKAKNANRALKIYAEYIEKYCPREGGYKPRPQFLEVDRSGAGIDPLWRVPLEARTQFTQRTPITLPALNKFERPDWRLTRIGLAPSRKDQFYLSNLHLQAADYFPNRGDQINWDGYRYTIMNVVIPPEAYWGPTNIWMGLVCEAVIAPEGDAKPLGNLTPPPAEIGPTPPPPPKPSPFSYPEV